MSELSQSSAWLALRTLAANPPNMTAMFKADSTRANHYHLKVAGVELDYSKNIINAEIMDALLALASHARLSERIHAMFEGEPINTTEHRPALHTALRASRTNLVIGGVDIDKAISTVRKQMYDFAERVRDGRYTGYTGKAIESVVNIGIGGSELGARMMCTALGAFSHKRLRFHFVSNVDDVALRSVLEQLDPQTTLFIIQSKSFTTQETMLNARIARDWFMDSGAVTAAQCSAHFVAVTANLDAAIDFGIDRDGVFVLWEWVGGRYSLWSAVGLPVVLAVGATHFDALLAGARAMDEHFRDTPAASNMPVVLALLGIWYCNFLEAQTHALVPYCERLSVLPAHVQQLDMESNGKSQDSRGNPVDYNTAPIVWGQTGTNGQHAFFQLLHQGTRLVPIDLVAARMDSLSASIQQRALLTHMIAQAAVLMSGRRSSALPAYKEHTGNRPSNILLLDALNPSCLGALVALYEHKVFVQGVIWGVNSFDQWGVEWGKQLAQDWLGASGDVLPGDLDPSSARLLKDLGCARS